MIRHIAVFTFRPEFSAEQREHWMGLLRALPAQIPGLHSISVGEDIVRSPNSYEIGLVADFDDREALDRYMNHPAHQEILDISGPEKTSLAVVDFVHNEQSPTA